ncbi:MAG: hypothetical protein M3036_03125 [Bifidobacteriales bacterium]|nr:hypothetical protein [Bifidobacteriales bacterium]PHI96910.1 hypothetical protein BG621_02650 [Parasaccharibacter apium]
MMKRAIFSLFATSMLVGMAAPAMAEPGGCLKYGAAGAVAGHVAHQHAVAGAVGGCAVGMYQRHKYRKSIAEKAALWDKEHPVESKQNGSGWWQKNNSAAAKAQKAQWYDAEHANGDAQAAH